MERSEIMRAVKGRDTTPERVVRKVLRGIAPGYRLHRRDLPGAPDIAFPGRKKVIFVHGCFWHGHDCKRGARMPKANADYWRAKIAKNRARDEKHQAAYATMGFDLLTIWECETRDEAALAEKLRAFVGPAQDLLSSERTSSTSGRRRGDGKARTTVPSEGRKPLSGSG
jgi:DNA mismatch endonuclease, patch repair protein